MNKFPILYGLMLILTLGACTGEFDFSREEVNVLKVEQRLLTFSEAASSKTLAVSSDADWTVQKELEADWLTVEHLSDGISVSVADNPTIVERKCILEITAGERKTAVKVRQSGIVPAFTTTSDMISVDHGSENMTIDFQANVEWEADTYCDWMVLTKTASGLSVAIPENLSDKRRTAYVDFYNAGQRFARILVSQASSVPQPLDYYTVDISATDWNASYVHYVNDETGCPVALITKESLDGVSTVVRIYPAPSGTASFADGKNVAETVKTAYIDSDGTGVYTEDPRVGFERVEVGSLVPLTLTSDVRTHGAVKVGQQIWLAEDYKTTKMADGTSIPQYSDGSVFWADGAKAVVTHDGHYMYSAYTLGWDGSEFDDSNFAPQGWAVPTSGQYMEFLEKTGKNLGVISEDGAYLFGATMNYKATPSGGKVKVGPLNYTNTWSSTRVENKNQIYMVYLNPTNNTKWTSGQDPKNGFSVRLIKK